MKRDRIKKIWNWVTNILLGLIILTLIIPSWRVKFQGFVQVLFIQQATVEPNLSTAITLKPNDWLLKDKTGQSIDFSSLKGKPILLNFWATWCPSCRAELPELANLHDLIGTDIQVICVTNENFETIAASGLLEAYGHLLYSAPQFHPNFNFSVYPTSFIIDRQFKIISKIEGARKFDSDENIHFLKGL